MRFRVDCGNVTADQVWEFWDVGMIPDELAGVAWSILAFGKLSREVTNESDQ